MPLTFPSHAAAILPLLTFRGRRLPPSALVIGSAAPDLVYLVGTLGGDAHRPPGLFPICVPAGLVAFLYFETLVAPVLGPALVAVAPTRLASTAARLFTPRPLPRDPAGWFFVALAVQLGAVTHQLWDGFTHAWLWPARTLYPDTTVALFGRPILLARVLQHGSSVVGLVIVLLYLYRTAPPRRDASAPDERAAAARRLLAVLALPVAAGGLAALLRLGEPDPLLTRALWDAAWSGVAWAAALLGVACLIVRLRDRTAGG